MAAATGIIAGTKTPVTMTINAKVVKAQKIIEALVKIKSRNMWLSKGRSKAASLFTSRSASENSYERMNQSQ